MQFKVFIGKITLLFSIFLELLSFLDISILSFRSFIGVVLFYKKIWSLFYVSWRHKWRYSRTIFLKIIIIVLLLISIFWFLLFWGIKLFKSIWCTWLQFLFLFFYFFRLISWLLILILILIFVWFWLFLLLIDFNLTLIVNINIFRSNLNFTSVFNKILLRAICFKCCWF